MAGTPFAGIILQNLSRAVTKDMSVGMQTLVLLEF
jgi:hypothetical protein